MTANLATNRAADVAAIAAGALAPDEALWQLGRDLLCHTSHMIEIARGSKAYGNELGWRSTSTDGMYLGHHHTRGVWIERILWRPPTTEREEVIAKINAGPGERALIADQAIVWKSRWGPIVAPLRPVLADQREPLVVEVIAAARDRRAEVASWPPSWSPSTDPRNAPEVREARTQRWFEIEDRCRSAAAAVWDAARPGQGTLW
jgi:hypothetical protein